MGLALRLVVAGTTPTLPMVTRPLPYRTSSRPDPRRANFSKSFGLHHKHEQVLKVCSFTGFFPAILFWRQCLKTVGLKIPTRHELLIVENNVVWFET